MNSVLVFISIVAGVFGIFGGIVALVTRFNHVEHQSVDIKDLKEFKGKTEEKLTNLEVGQARMEEKLDGIIKVCQERHKQ
jgi:hypothetical protein